jgi:hypothetical protein
MTRMVGAVSVQMIVVAIHDRCAVRDVGIVVVDDVAAVVPIESPAVPAPAEAGMERKTEAQSKSDSRTVKE